jgi:hypothetical protein
MKFTFLLFLLFVSAFLQAQSRPDYARIDEYVRNLEAPAMDSLARMLVKPFTSDADKVRAVYSWIAQHISYNTHILKGSVRVGNRYATEVFDTAFNWKSAVEMTALKAFTRRNAVCDGYAKLFKTLCDYGGIQSEIVTGYARGYTDSEIRFRSNHTWNAVMIDGNWQLLDVTWGSGYVTYGNRFVQKLEDHYFLTKPELFYEDHVPEDLRWSLLAQWPALPEMKHMPFRYKSYVKYSINSFYPAAGTIEVGKGDTLHFQINVTNLARDKAIAPDPFVDSLDLASSEQISYIHPAEEKHGKLMYAVVIADPSISWIALMYNNDAVLRYRLTPRSDVPLR